MQFVRAAARCPGYAEALAANERVSAKLDVLMYDLPRARRHDWGKAMRMVHEYHASVEKDARLLSDFQRSMAIRAICMTAEFQAALERHLGDGKKRAKLAKIAEDTIRLYGCWSLRAYAEDEWVRRLTETTLLFDGPLRDPVPPRSGIYGNSEDLALYCAYVEERIQLHVFWNPMAVLNFTSQPRDA